MALPAGMGLSAAAAAAGYSYQSPNPTPEPVDSALTAQVTASEDPEEMLLGGLAALSEPEPPYPGPGNSLLGSSEEIRGSRSSQGAVVGVVDPAQIQMRQQEPQQQIQQPQQLQLPQQQPRQQQRQQQEEEEGEEHQQPPPQQQRHSMMQPMPPPRIHQVTSPPPPHPPASMLNVIDDLRSGGGAVLPGGGVGLQAMLRAKRELRTLRATVALSEEVKKRFPFQAAQSVRLTAAEEKLDKKISAVRRRLYCKLENVEWASKSLRVWLSLEVISDAKSGASGGKASGLQQQQQQQPEDLLLDGGKGVPTQRAGPGSAEGAGEGQRSSKAGWCVLARVQGTVIDVPADGVERRFTSFFSKVVLRLDSKAFPGVATVEWVRSKGCEELHCVELKLPLERALRLGMKAVNVKVFLHPRLDDGRPRRFTLSPRLRRALCLSDRVETKPVLVAAACEALRHRGLISSPSIGGAARGGAGGVGIPMIACDPPLENIIGSPAFPFSQLEEALGPHVEPAAPPMLEATIALVEGSMREARLDVRVDTGAPFQLQAAKCLLGDAAGQSPAAVPQEEAQEAAAASAGMGGQNGAVVGLGVVKVQEQEARAQLDRQISYLVEAVNSSGRRAAMLRALSEDPMEVVPRLEAQMLADEEMLGAAAGVERPARLGEFEPWLDVDVCGKVIETREEERKKYQVRRVLEAQRKERAAQHARADAALQQAAREQRKQQREARAAAQAVAAAKHAAQREREQQQQQQRQRLRLREAQERAVLEGKEMKRRQQQQHQEKQHQRMQQAVMLARQAKQAQAHQAQEQQARAARAAKVAARQEVKEQRAAQDAVATGRGTPVTAVTAAMAAGIPSDALGRMRAMQQRQNQTPVQGPHRVGAQGQHIGQQQQQQLRHTLPPQGAASLPRDERVTPPILTSDPIAGAREQTQQLQGLAAAAAALTASNIAFQGHHKKQQQQQQALPLPSLGPGLGPSLEERFQQQQHQQQHNHHEQTHQQEDAAITMDAEERKRQELLEQTLLSPNDDLDPPTPQPQPRPAPSPSRQQIEQQQQQQQYQWPTSGAVSLFPSNPDVTDRCFQQATPTGRGGGIRQQQQQQQQQQHIEPPPRVGSAGSPQVNEGDSRQQQMEEAWLRRRQHLEQQHLEQQHQQRQRQGIPPISHIDHGGGGGQAAQGFQGQLLGRQLAQEDQQQSSSPFDGSAPTALSADIAPQGAVQDAFRGGLVTDRQRKEQRTEDQRHYRQRQYQQLAQLAHIQRQQQRQRQGLVQAGQGGAGIASAVSGLLRPAQRGEETILQQAEWARRVASARGQPLGGALQNEISAVPPQSLRQGSATFDPQGGHSQAGTPTEPDAAGDVLGGGCGAGGGGIEEQQHPQQRPQQQQQSPVSSYSGWQSQAERRRSDATVKK